MRPGIIVGLFYVVLSHPLASSLEAGEATDQVKRTTDNILAVLNDSSLQGVSSAAARRRLIRDEAHNRFDWPEICRRSLARHWRKRTKEERIQCGDLFSQLMEKTYAGKLETYYTDLKEIKYLKERQEGSYASVKLLVVTTKGVEFPVEYRLKKKGEEWLIYEVVIEGISMVKNYRSQFNEIILKSGYDGLLETIKKKIEEAK